jgi:ADP-heptose:LPS heptosyltransferase
MLRSFSRSEPRRLAVLRAGGLGDLVMALPAIASIREAHPAAHVSLLGSRWIARLQLPRRGIVDEAIALPDPALRALSGALPLDDPAVGSFLDRHRSRYDLAVQLHGGGRYSNPFVLALDAGSTVGLRATDAPPLDHDAPYRYWQSEIERGLDVAALVGGRRAAPQPRLPLLAGDRAAATTVLVRSGWDPEDGRPLVVIHPGATDPRRRWSARFFARVGDELAAAGASVVLAGSGLEQEIAGAVASSMSKGVITVAGRTSIRALVGLLHRASLVIANDSGPLHLANAVGTRTVGIYWCGNLINAGPSSRLRQRALLSWRLECPTCGVDCMRGRCEHRASFVDEIHPDEVTVEALDLLDGRLATATLGSSTARPGDVTAVQPTLATA